MDELLAWLGELNLTKETVNRLTGPEFGFTRVVEIAYYDDDDITSICKTSGMNMGQKARFCNAVKDARNAVSGMNLVRICFAVLSLF
jgi:hypothetical protein